MTGKRLCESLAGTPVLKTNLDYGDKKHRFPWNKDCDLPCFWGIIPHKSSLEQVNQDFGYMGKKGYTLT